MLLRWCSLYNQSTVLILREWKGEKCINQINEYYLCSNVEDTKFGDWVILISLSCKFRVLRLFNEFFPGLIALCHHVNFLQLRFIFALLCFCIICSWAVKTEGTRHNPWVLNGSVQEELWFIMEKEKLCVCVRVCARARACTCICMQHVFNFGWVFSSDSFFCFLIQTGSSIY